MTSVFPPGLILIFGAILVPFLRGRVKSAYIVLLPVVAFIYLISIPKGSYTLFNLLDNPLLMHMDKLSMLFAYVFILVTFIGMIYSLHVKGSWEHTAAFVLAGSALGIVFAGDFISLFIFWEMLTFSALAIIWSNRTERSREAGLRYLLVHLFGGVCLMTGIILRYINIGSVEFDYMGMDGLDTYLILLGFAINAAVPPVHAWLTDAYPEASVTGIIFLSAFTTKSALYVMARAFPGAEILIILGVFMAVYPVLFAILDNDLRRVLAYGMISQSGFMVVGIGIGIPLSINGATGHAFASVIYMALMFMAIGAVMHRVGTAKATELGGLYRTMPWTLTFFLVGAASICALPLFSGFVAKSLTLSAAGYKGLLAVYIGLTTASVGAVIYAGFKVPYYTFFGQDSGKRPQEAPVNMLVAMGIAAGLSAAIGVFPNAFYSILPHGVEYAPYTVDHVTDQLMLVGASGIAIAVAMYVRLHPRVHRDTNVDVDWIYRKFFPSIVSLLAAPLFKLNERVSRYVLEKLPEQFLWFGKNPLTALRIASDTLILSFSGNSAEPKERIADTKERYPGSVKELSLSVAVGLALIFLAGYLLILLF